MKIASWNIRGLNLPLKQNGVCHLIRSNNLDVLAVLETKCSREKVCRFVKNKLPGWEFCDNFDLAKGGRILVIWNPDTVDLSLVLKHPQVIHCRIHCKISSHEFCISFIYAANALIHRREVWSSLTDFGNSLDKPWIVLGDFNNVLKSGERFNGRVVTQYEIKDFVNCCNSLGLVDIQSVGQLFTWSNNTVCSKLDRAMINQAWLESDHMGFANFLTAGCLSDHSPCVVSISAQCNRRKAAFRFFNMWTNHPSFIPTVVRSWNKRIRGSAQYVVCCKLKALKAPLKLCNQQNFSHISERVRIANSELKKAEEELQSVVPSPARMVNIAQLRSSAWLLSNAERSFLQQKAKCDFLLHSDKCSKFFHSLIKKNAKRNFIAAIKMPDGSISTSMEQVAEAFVKHFKALLGSYVPIQLIDGEVVRHGPVIGETNRLLLTRDILDEEIKNALDCIDDNKAPGPDGFSAKFFKASWNVVGGEISDSIREFFANAAMLKQINHAVIALIPKSSHSTMVGDFRPISCCNVLYKLISKIIAERLKPLLNSIVDKAQSAFLPGRQMVDNIHLMQQLIRGYNRKRISPRCIIKIDLEKAYDSISWEFLHSVLLGLRFPLMFVKWIMECVTTTSFSISINGGIHGFFKGKRGLRQGDPLSPYLFILCMEYLSRLIKRQTEGSEFNFHPQCGKLKITHLAFADDLMLLARGDEISIGILMDCLKEFGKCSGMQLNVRKSNIFMAGMDVGMSDDILQATRLSPGLMPFRYLGVPMAAAAPTVMEFEPMLQAISSCVNAWKGSTLSYAGRLELMRSVLQGIQCFWLTVFPLPATVREQINRICRSFLWNSKVAPVAWCDVCLPREEGGLNIRDLKAWNLSLLAKLLWNICGKKDSLWIQWIHHQYLRGTSIWNKIAHSRDPQLFKNILEIRDRLLIHATNKSSAEDLLKKWYENSGHKGRDSYDFFRQSGQIKPWAKLIWEPLLTPKHGFILWLGLKGRLSTKDRLWLQEVDLSCSLCGNGLESIQHLFFQCQVSACVWNNIRDWMGLNRSMSTLASAAKWLKKTVKGTSWLAKSKRIALAATVYFIWVARNKRIFEGKVPSIKGLIHQIKTHVYRILYGHYPHLITCGGVGL